MSDNELLECLVKFEKNEADKAIKRKCNENNAIFKTGDTSKKIKNEEPMTASNIWHTIYLDKSNSSWIKIVKLNDGLSMEQFEELWKMKPEKKLLIKIAGKNVECPRYSKNYLKSYRFSGFDHEADLNPPELVRILLKYSQTLNTDLNQCLANWYEADGYIGKHSDDTKQLKHDSEIFSFSFGPARRIFTLEPKKSGKRISVVLEHYVLVIMGGKCQFSHRHSVEKVKNDEKLNGRRVNVTFRCFK
jgi:alkylated DNA repair dioxygenase AlkB